MGWAATSRWSRFVLVAGDKAGNWQGWYETSIRLAEKRFAEHLADLEEG
ncbi:hypothetical protein BJ970_000448 [Saccharopolyspora phatthalungensis]|uniref:Uncharacterized protein n=1 Tax=Saccharopolyspora phatthalungensis TaxID=664693 RepID=A0A840PY89_9PSEU|nr:hypothetical protein [Saccharopolyspora phatthalungensis]